MSEPATRSRSRERLALVLGRAGLDLYPQPDGCRLAEAESFVADLGGSAGNIAAAMARAGARVGLLSALSADGVGEFVRARLAGLGVELELVAETRGNERTSLALAEVRAADCEVVIYRNDPADLAYRFTPAVDAALAGTSHLVVTGTSLIDAASRAAVAATMLSAREHGCRIWFDLDYRAWNWPSPEQTREVYAEAAAAAQVLVGNDEEFAVLDDDIERLAATCRARGQVMVQKRGAAGSSVFVDDGRLDSGIYPLPALKPYGSGDAFLGNLIVHLDADGDWQRAIAAASAAAAFAVSRRGCGAAMPDPAQLAAVQRDNRMQPASHWS